MLDEKQIDSMIKGVQKALGSGDEQLYKTTKHALERELRRNWKLTRKKRQEIKDLLSIEFAA